MLHDTIRLRLKRLLDRLLEGAVIPFVGAGISLGSRVPNSSFRPTVDYLEKQLRDRLNRDTDNADESDQSDESIVDQHRLTRSFYQSDDNKPTLAWLAELGALLWGQAEMCEVLQISEFAKLGVSPAHRYLAYLAREGLVTEIISTNYDCCIEHAYWGSFGQEPLEPSLLAMINTLADYRSYGSHLFVDLRPTLRLYKINGCAAAYKKSRPRDLARVGEDERTNWRKAAERIILTERQLQTFRNERWAEDWFRDRARTRNFMFCGFGSDEAQVRHTALSLVAEFQASARQGDGLSLSETANLPNAPFIAAYDEHPSFTQLQILAAFTNAYVERDGGAPLSGMSSGLDLYLSNLFSGKDVCNLDAEAAPTDEPKLTADQFLRCLFQCAFQHLLERELEPGAQFWNWLRRQTHQAATWVTQLRAVLTPQGPTPQPIKPLGPWSMLLEPSDDAGPFRLWHWLWVMQHPDRASSPPSDWYLPLREDSLFVLSTLLILRCLTLNADDSNGNALRRVKPVLGGGLEVAVEPEYGGPRVVYLVHERAKLGIETPPTPSENHNRLIRRIALPSARFFDNQSRWKLENKSQLMGRNPPIIPLHVGRQVVIAAEDLIHAAQTPERFLDVLQRVQAGIRVQPRAVLKLLSLSKVTHARL